MAKSESWVCRTLLYGGVAMNPRSHLRLVYEANPLGFLAEQVGPPQMTCCVSDVRLHLSNLQMHGSIPCDIIYVFKGAQYQDRACCQYVLLGSDGPVSMG